MSSRRALITKNFISTLKNKTDAKDRVFPNATVPAWMEELPVILVYPRDESSELFSQSPLELKRVVTFGIEVLAKGTEEPFDKAPKEPGPTVTQVLDKLARQIECALHANITLGVAIIDGKKDRAVADDMILSSTEFEFRDDGSEPIGAARLNYLVTYYERAPETIDKQSGITDLNKINADWHIGHHNEDPDLTQTEAQDEVVIPQT